MMTFFLSLKFNYFLKAFNLATHITRHWTPGRVHLVTSVCHSGHSS